MKYFILKQDKNLNNAIKIKEFNSAEKVILSKEDKDKYVDGLVLHVKGDKYSVFPHLIEVPVFLISERMYKIFEWYENTIVYKTCMLVNSEQDIREIYRVCIFDKLDALSSKTTYLKNGWVDKVVLDSKKIGDYNIFLVKAGVDYYIIASLDVVESLLKRKIFAGVSIEEVEVE